MDKHLEETTLLDTSHPELAALVTKRGWNDLRPYDAIGAIYDFVRNEVRFGYNASDDMPASSVLSDGYGQCNTKGTLLMALLRSVGVRCRLHGFTIDKKLQRGAVTGLAYQLAPRSIIHSWVEVDYRGRWVNLEGFILDSNYLDGVRCLFPEAKGAFYAKHGANLSGLRRLLYVYAIRHLMNANVARIRGRSVRTTDTRVGLRSRVVDTREPGTRA